VSPNLSACRHTPLERLRHLLAGYLVMADPYRWPGTDGLTEEDVLLDYFEAVRQGRVPDRDELARRHPELAQAVAEFFEHERAVV
jgi:hypothetical protein